MHSLIDDNSIIVRSGDETLIVSASDPTYTAVRRYLLDERGEDFDELRAMIDGIRVPVKSAAADAVAAVDGDEGSAYRIEHGDPVEEIILASALRVARENADMAPLGRFLQRLENNPSQASRSQLFGWLKAGGFTITTDGMIVGYKSVRSDGRSSNGGREPVTVAYQGGRSETITGHIPYPLGAWVSMPRELVDDNRDSACSVGLHVGTYNYAENFSEKMLVVLVDPADVVSVPRCSGAQKMRVCRLYVAAQHDGEQISETVVDNIRTVPDFDAAEEYYGREENQAPALAGCDYSYDIDDLDDDDDLDLDDDDDLDDDEDEDDEDDERENSEFGEYAKATYAGDDDGWDDRAASVTI